LASAAKRIIDNGASIPCSFQSILLTTVGSVGIAETVLMDMDMIPEAF
jgi:hypothetical protein